MTVAREGDSTFQIGCDVSLANELALLNYRPATGLSAGRLTAISFVPENFRLKTLVEMNAARAVAIDDDTVRRSRPSVEVNPDSIHRSIAQSLRKLQKGEQRVGGTIEKIDCDADHALFTVSASGKTYKLARSSSERPEIGWFTVASSQFSLACGSGPIQARTLISFAPVTQQNPLDGVIKAIEFVPEGFIP
jgi:hypothetical protein